MLAWPPERSSSLETDVTAGVLIMEELPAGRFSADSLLPGEMLSAGHGAVMVSRCRTATAHWSRDR
jgi:hypothetical protein